MRILALPIIFCGFMLASARIVGSVFDAPTDGFVGQFMLQLQSPVMGVFGIMAIMFGGFAFVFGTGPSILDLAWGEAEPKPAPRPSVAPRPVPALPMTEAARAANAKVDGLLSRFRNLPTNTVTDEARIEFDLIATKHLPNLKRAHAEARQTVPATGGEADALDADFAVSAERLAESLADLVEDSSDVARGRLETERRFIEVRHPSDGFDGGNVG